VGGKKLRKNRRLVCSRVMSKLPGEKGEPRETFATRKKPLRAISGNPEAEVDVK